MVGNINPLSFAWALGSQALKPWVTQTERLLLLLLDFFLFFNCVYWCEPTCGCVHTVLSLKGAEFRGQIPWS